MTIPYFYLYSCIFPIASMVSTNWIQLDSFFHKYKCLNDRYSVIVILTIILFIALEMRVHWYIYLTRDHPGVLALPNNRPLLLPTLVTILHKTNLTLKKIKFIMSMINNDWNMVRRWSIEARKRRKRPSWNQSLKLELMENILHVQVDDVPVHISEML